MRNKKIKITLISFYILCQNIFSFGLFDVLNVRYNQTYLGVDKFQFVSFLSEETVEFIDEEAEATDILWNKTYKYSFSKNDGLYFLELIDNGKKIKLLALIAEKYLVLYSTDNSKLLFCGINGINGEGVSFSSCKATSELKEKNKIYSASNLSNLNSDEPWAESVNGNGIGEKIYTRINARHMIIFSGYISAKKPYLWKQNARPKKIGILFPATEMYKEFDLQDTPNPQILDFGEVYSGDIEIILLDIYKGTKYEDTCIHSIMFDYF